MNWWKQKLSHAQKPASRVLGRDGLIQQIWITLETHSVLLNAERRMGKTSVLEKMEREGPPSADWIVLKADMEHVYSWREFVSTVYDQLAPHLGKRLRLGATIQNFLADFGAGTEIKGFLKLPEIEPAAGKRFLRAIMADMAGSSSSGKVIFLWDEVPDMLNHIAEREGQNASMELLDVLRAIRQQHPDRIRMVYTGSIGLHHVISKLKDSGYTNSPVNDMTPIEVKPLQSEHAIELASRCVEKGVIEEPEAVCRALAAVSDYVPFYIDRLAYALVADGVPISVKAINAKVEVVLRDPNTPFDLRHFHDRLKVYYANNAPVALLVLDVIAPSEAPLPFIEIYNRVQSATPHDRELVLAMVKLLERDYYIANSTKGYDFRLTLVKRFWRIERGLE